MFDRRNNIEAVNFLKKNEITIPRLLQEQQSLFKLWDCEDKFLNVVLIP